MDHAEHDEAGARTTARTTDTAASATPASVVDAFDLSALEGAQLWQEQLRSDRIAVPLVSRQTAQAIADGALRRQSAPVRKLFVRREDGVSPLAAVYAAGGRSGVVAVKLYLSIIWRCSAPPYQTSATARGWATLLGLEDPEGRGARRVAAALKTLVAHQLVQVTPQAGQPHLITLLDESGDGTEYTLPSTTYQRAPDGPRGDAQRERSRYFQVPGRLWTEGRLQALPGPGVIMLLILLAEQGGQGVPVWFSTESFPARYRISHKTRAAGTQQLIAQGLLLVERQALAAKAHASALDTRRYRNVYHLQGSARTESTTEAAAKTAAAGSPSSSVTSAKYPKPRRRARR